SEEAAEDSCLAEQRELSRVEPVETAREQGLDPRGRLFESQLRSLPGVGEELLGEERVPAGVFRDPLLELVDGFACELLDQGSEHQLGKGIELDEEAGRRRPAPT